MANQPERPIEKLLREAARQRRDRAGAPFEIHPATRRLLQGEVVRQFPPSPAPAPRSFLAIFWPRWALGVGAFLLLFIGVVAVFPPGPGKKELTLAKNEVAVEASKTPSAVREQGEAVQDELRSEGAPLLAPSEISRDKATSEIAAVPSRGPTVAAPYGTAVSDTKGEEPVVIGIASSGVVAAAPDSTGRQMARADRRAPAAAAPSVQRYGLPGSSGGVRAGEPTGQLLDGGAIAPQPAPEPVRSKTLAVAQESAAVAPTTSSQQFADVEPSRATMALAFQDFERTALAKPPAPTDSASSAVDAVMVSFRLEQAGPEFRVIDRDGSVYRGYLQASVPPDSVGEPQAVARLARPAPTSAPSPAVKKSPAPGYAFEVTGTNLTLKQKVVFTGSLVPSNSMETVANAPASAAVGAQASAPRLPLPNSRISGKVLVGDRQPVEINAVPAKQ